MRPVPQVNSWKVNFSNERDPYLVNTGTLVKTEKETHSIPRNTLLLIKDVVYDTCGVAIVVEYQSADYTLNPKYLRYITVLG